MFAKQFLVLAGMLLVTVIITLQWCLSHLTENELFVVGWVARSKKRLRVSGIHPSPPTCWGGWYSNEKIHGCWSSKSSHQKNCRFGDRLFFLSHVGTNPWFFGGSKSHEIFPSYPSEIFISWLFTSNRHVINFCCWTFFFANRQCLAHHNMHASLLRKFKIRCPSPRGYTWNGTPNSWRIFPSQNPSMDEKWG